MHKSAAKGATAVAIKSRERGTWSMQIVANETILAHCGRMQLPLNSSANRTAAERRPSKLRSRVSNGKTLFVEADQRGPWARRWRDVLGEIISDLGGADRLSEGQKQLARRCATIAIACEKLEGEAAQGHTIDLDAYGTLTDRLGRALQRLGLHRQPRTVEPPSPLAYARQIDADDAEGWSAERRCQQRVKSGKAQTEQMFSGLCLKADACLSGRHAK